jgi:hypothetical protein
VVHLKGVEEVGVVALTLQVLEEIVFVLIADILPLIKLAFHVTNSNVLNAVLA